VKHVTTPAAMKFWMEGALALADVEHQGVRIDKTYLEGAITSTTKEINDAEAALRSDKDFKLWRRRFGEKTKPGSYDQLAAVVFRDLGVPSKKRTASGDRESAAAAAFEGLDIPLVKHFLTAAKLKKARDAYLVGIQREMVQHDDGLWYVHCSYNLNSVITFRSSCSNTNYQNNPKRNPKMMETVRKCYISRPGYRQGELDYGQIEVRIPCPYTFDPVLMAYVCDPTKDMHRDMAVQIFKLKPNQVSKALRNLVKADYVFATFYGSYYGLTAPALWEGVDNGNLTLEGSEKTVRQHLTDIGFTELGTIDDEKPEAGTWAAHVRGIDEDFWGKRFKVYAQWKRDWYEAYCRDGGFTMLTGFAVHAPLDKKQVCNSPVQGVAFHCLLWSLTKLVNRLRKYKMQSKVIGEVHDSINLDIHPAELDDVFDMATSIMTEEIKVWAPWLNVPLVCECESSPTDGSWFDVMGMAKRDGGYVPADPAKWQKRFGAWDGQLVTA